MKVLKNIFDVGKKLGFSRKKFYAEFETDLILRKNFFPDFDYQGVFIEVGGATPEFLSMSKHFKDTGWRCVVVEPNPEFIKLQKAAGNEVVECACSKENIDSAPFRVVNWTNIPAFKANQISEHSFSSLEVKKEYLKKHGFETIEDLPHHTIQVKVRTLNSILEEKQISRIDILSIDTEGWELEVMDGMDTQRFRPTVVVLENYLSLNEYNDYMRVRGYELAQQCGHNSVFRRLPA